MSVIKYRPIGKERVGDWYAMASVNWPERRAVGTLYVKRRGSRHGSMHRHFDVKVRDDGEFRVGMGGPNFHLRFRYNPKRAMDKMVRQAVARLKKKVEA